MIAARACKKPTAADRTVSMFTARRTSKIPSGRATAHPPASLRGEGDCGWCTSLLRLREMAAKKKPKRKPTTHSGPNIPDSQRHTKRVTVHVAPEVEKRWRTLAHQRGETLSGLATRAIELLDAEARKGRAR